MAGTDVDLDLEQVEAVLEGEEEPAAVRRGENEEGGTRHGGDGDGERILKASASGESREGRRNSQTDGVGEEETGSSSQARKKRRGSGGDESDDDDDMRHVGRREHSAAAAGDYDESPTGESSSSSGKRRSGEDAVQPASKRRRRDGSSPRRSDDEDDRSPPPPPSKAKGGGRDYRDDEEDEYDKSGGRRRASSPERHRSERRRGSGDRGDDEDERGRGRMRSPSPQGWYRNSRAGGRSGRYQSHRDDYPYHRQHGGGSGGGHHHHHHHRSSGGGRYGGGYSERSGRYDGGRSRRHHHGDSGEEGDQHRGSSNRGKSLTRYSSNDDDRGVDGRTDEKRNGAGSGRGPRHSSSERLQRKLEGEAGGDITVGAKGVEQTAEPKDPEDRRSAADRELEEARRGDQTVFVRNLALKATELDIWKFFSQHAGRVRDIQMIRDLRSGKSKGVGYVEFYTQQAADKSLALSGHDFMGQPIGVHSSQAEKNRAAKIAKQQAAEAAEGGPMRIYVGGLTGNLANITEEELRQLFTPFGPVTSVEINRDPYTQQCRGFAFVSFQNASDAGEAMTGMNGFEIAGSVIRVGFATDSAVTGGGVPGMSAVASLGGSAASAAVAQQLAAAGNLTVQQQLAAAQAAAAALSWDDTPDTERLDDDGGGLLSGASTRVALMQKLQRDTPSVPAAGLAAPSAGAAAAAALPAMYPGGAAAAAALTAQMTCNLMLSNLFSPEEALGEDESFFDEIVDDVTTECSKHGSVVKVLVNRKVPDGKVYVKFAGADHAARAGNALGGRKFDGRVIEAEFINEVSWESVSAMAAASAGR